MILASMAEREQLRGLMAAKLRILFQILFEITVKDAKS
jgi:hypothetical protein